MAIIYLRSTDGSDSDNGSTWALAKATLAGALAIAVPGDTIYVSQVHAESQASLMLLAVDSTLANPVKIVCANDGAQPPTTLATTATVSTTGNNQILMTGGPVYCYGITFTSCIGGNAGPGTGDITLWSGTYESCDFYLASSGGPTLNLYHGLRRNMGVKFGDATQKVESDGVIWRGGRVLSGSSTPNTLFGQLSGTPSLVEGIDFSNFTAGFDFFSSNIGYVTVRNCKLPSGWSGTLYGVAPIGGSRHELRNCSAGDSNYDFWVEDECGSIRHETTIIKSGGFNDGVNTVSWKMATSADGDELGIPLVSPEIVRWNTTIGSTITAYVDIVHDSVTNLQDDEIWLEVQYLGTSGFPLTLFASNRIVGFIFTTAVDHAASTASWVTTGLTNPNRQKLSLSFTPQEKGFLHATVHMSKISYTVYVDPTLVIT